MTPFNHQDAEPSSTLSLEHVEEAERQSQDVPEVGGYSDRLAEISRTYSNREAPDPDANTSDESFSKDAKPDTNSDNSDNDDDDKLTDEERAAIETVKSTFVNLFTNPPSE